MYSYGGTSTTGIFPTNTFGAANYWVDVVFTPSGGANQPPVANNDSGYTTTQNTALTIAAAALLANDTDPDGGTLTITGASGAVNGTVSFNSQTNMVTFTPTTGYTGPASFSYAIADGQGGTATATVSLTVNAAPNQPPVANNDSGYSATQNTALTIAASALLANDTDPNGDPLTITGVSGAVNGTVSFNAQTNVVTFTPTTGYTGAASFSYAISDGRGGIATATANLTVNTPTVSLFSSSNTPAVLSDSDTAQVNLGVRFTSSSAGTITGIKYYKGANDTGTHTGSLWSSTGTLLATATFTNETASGWQTVTFSNPVSITTGTTYVASYPQQRPLHSHRQLLHHCSRQWPAHGTRQQQWRLHLRHRQSVPDQHLRCHQLLGGRALQPRERRYQPSAGRGERLRLQRQSKLHDHDRSVGVARQRHRSERR